MIEITPRFDGRVIIPDEPLDLPRDQALIVRIETVGGCGQSEAGSALSWLAEHAADEPGLPALLSHQRDHYLYAC